MELDKLVYEVIEDVSAISDDRYLDERLIIHKINSARADLVRKMMNSKPGYPTQGLEQDFPLVLESVTRSIFPGLTIPCNILRSTQPIPDLISTRTLSEFYKVRTVDILKNTIEIIEPNRANFVVFEFPVVYAFVYNDDYLYLLAPEHNQELKRAILTGVFDDPTAVEDPLEDYPIKASDWALIKPLIVQDILNRPMEDPLNNSETDYARQQNKQGAN
jgi:hypothetical protein